MSVKVGEAVFELRAKATQVAVVPGNSFEATWRRINAVLDLPEEEIHQIRRALLDVGRPTPPHET